VAALTLPASLGPASARDVSHPPPPDEWGQLTLHAGRAVFVLGPAGSKTRRVESSLIGDIGVPTGTSVAGDHKGKGDAHFLIFRGDSRCLFHAQGYGTNVIVTTCPPPSVSVGDAKVWIRAENLRAQPRVLVVDFTRVRPGA
jgi:hypothetical protein